MVVGEPTGVVNLVMVTAMAARSSVFVNVRMSVGMGAGMPVGHHAVVTIGGTGVVDMLRRHQR